MTLPNSFKMASVSSGRGCAIRFILHRKMEVIIDRAIVIVDKAIVIIDTETK